MQKRFNTAGPCVPPKHYMITHPPCHDKIIQLIDHEAYFVLHAPRQTGKTTLILQLADSINQAGNNIALYISVEAGQAWRNSIDQLNRTIINELRNKAEVYLPPDFWPSQRCYNAEVSEFSVFLTRWCMELPKPLVLFIDELDALIGDGLISVLRQLRNGYAQRPKAFPLSLCLIGVRDVRDYRIYSDASKRYIVGGSAFNIKEKSIRVNDFSAQQVAELYAQHTTLTGQRFSQNALSRAYELTMGQPWLVNALAREVCFEEFAIDQGMLVEVEHIDQAAEILIQRRDVHLDQLADKLTEPRVAKIIQTLLTGEAQPEDSASFNEDLQYLLDLGLVRKGRLGLEIANPIYREVIPRELTWYREDMIGQDPNWYIKENSHLDISKVLAAYIDFYKEHSELITKRKTYTEAAHHLLFMAWLQRIVNGGGQVRREYAAGMGRLDLYIEFAGERFAFELKLHSKYALERGRKQLSDYLSRLNLEQGWLIIFSRKTVINWDDVGRQEQIQENGKNIIVLYL